MAKSACFILLCIQIIVLLSEVSIASSEDVCTHSLNVQTGNKLFAGTDAIVSLTLYDNQDNNITVPNVGSLGQLGRGYNYFERGHLDIFSFSTTSCLKSPVCKVVISHDNSGFGPGWYLDTLTIRSTGPSMESPCIGRFEFHHWLSLRDQPYSLSATKSIC